MRISVLGSAEEAGRSIPTRVPVSLALLGTCEGVENRVLWEKMSDLPTTVGEEYSVRIPYCRLDSGLLSFPGRTCASLRGLTK